MSSPESRGSLKPQTRSGPTVVVLVIAVAAAAIAGGWLWWQQRAPATAPVAAAPPPVVAASTAASAPAAHYPVPAASGPAEAADLPAALQILFGEPAVTRLFQTDDFAHRFVATVDNLGRGAAPASVWPLRPVQGRFEASTTPAGAQVIAPGNAARYAAYVVLLEHVDLDRAVASYVHFYPELQRAYQELGFPHAYFNDRFVAVLDRLLATPEPGAAVKVHLPDLATGVKTSRPWLLYEFDDPALQSLDAGQRTLVRMGVDNERRVKLRLAELRRRLAALDRR
jgi:hypothetical protein